MDASGSALALGATVPLDVASPEVAADIGRDFMEALERFIQLSGQRGEVVYKASGKSAAILEKWAINSRIEMLAVERLDLFFASAGAPGSKAAVLYGPPPEVRWLPSPRPSRSSKKEYWETCVQHASSRLGARARISSI